MMKQPLLSVIVPCYNVEKYIDKCISSIVNQTYSNLEILLVDDGSTDTTGLVCDTWQEKDQHIRVIHQQNQGPSYARKTGIEKATAEYVTFVDADDWIEANMYSDMMTALLSTNSDITQCGVCLVFEDGSIEYCDSETKTKTFEVVGHTEGVLLILEDKKWHSWMWNKIFKRHLFEHVVFPKVLTFNEDFISLDLFHHASQSVYLPDPYYYYFQRAGSILNTNTFFSQMKSDYQYAVAIHNRYLFVDRHPQYYCMLQAIKKRAVLAGVASLRNIIAYPQFFPDDSFKSQVERLRIIPISLKDTIPILFKIDVWLLKILPAECYKTCRMFYKKIYSVRKLRKADINH